MLVMIHCSNDNQAHGYPQFKYSCIGRKDELQGRTYEEGLPSDKLDHLMIEVEYSHAKDDDFKLQMKKERRYVFEVNAEKFYGNGRYLIPVTMIKNSEWVWPTDEQGKEQMSLFE